MCAHSLNQDSNVGADCTPCLLQRALYVLFRDLSGSMKSCLMYAAHIRKEPRVFFTWEELGRIEKYNNKIKYYCIQMQKYIELY